MFEPRYNEKPKFVEHLAKIPFYTGSVKTKTEYNTDFINGYTEQLLKAENEALSLCEKFLEDLAKIIPNADVETMRTVLNGKIALAEKTKAETLEKHDSESTGVTLLEAKVKIQGELMYLDNPVSKKEFISSLTEYVDLKAAIEITRGKDSQAHDYAVARKHELFIKPHEQDDSQIKIDLAALRTIENHKNGVIELAKRTIYGLLP
jgi:hypothetical protein